MKDEAVHIRIHHRGEGEILYDGVNVTDTIGSIFVCIRRGFRQVWIRIPQNRDEYFLSEERWDPKHKRFVPSAFSWDENT